MHWDLLEEHRGAYDEEVCKKIDELTDLFDIIPDDIRLYPSMMCVDVFPCTESFQLSKDDLNILQEVYMGILFSG